MQLENLPRSEATNLRRQQNKMITAEIETKKDLTILVIQQQFFQVDVEFETTQ